jgi:hypothetical protein
MKLTGWIPVEVDRWGVGVERGGIPILFPVYRVACAYCETFGWRDDKWNQVKGIAMKRAERHAAWHEARGTPSLWPS